MENMVVSGDLFLSSRQFITKAKKLNDVRDLQTKDEKRPTMRLNWLAFLK